MATAAEARIRDRLQHMLEFVDGACLTSAAVSEPRGSRICCSWGSKARIWALARRAHEPFARLEAARVIGRRKACGRGGNAAAPRCLTR
jgi:hypothetical protein